MLPLLAAAAADSSMLVFDRFLFAFTVASHIILVTTSISLITLISIAEFVSVRRNDPYYGELASRLTKVFTISFGVGTASGVVMAVELSILFPGFMTLVAQTGAISLLYAEVFAFFLETLALVLYVYYPQSLRSRFSHWVLSVMILAGALMSAVFITMVNAWMNTPAGFDIAAFLGSGQITGVDPWAAFVTPSTFGEVVHVIMTTMFTGFALIGAYLAYRYLRSNGPDEKAMLSKGLKVCWVLSIILIVLVGLSGSNEMANLLQDQPLKYAALDANTVPGTDLPERFFGSISNGVWSGGISVPGAQSFLATLETGVSMLPGLSQFPQSSWPPLWVHSTFNVMIFGGIGVGVFLLAGLLLWLKKRRPFESKWMLYAQVVLGAASLVFYELGWVTDEVGRFPSIVYGVMNVDQAANIASSLLVPGLLVVAFYLVLIPLTFYFFFRVFRAPSTGHNESPSLEAVDH